MLQRVLRASGLSFAAVGFLGAQNVSAAQEVPTPESHFGYEIGSERSLANWTELTEYYELLAHASERVKVDTLGLTTMGRPFVMVTVTSEANQSRLAELHDIQMRLADPRRVSGRGPPIDRRWWGSLSAPVKHSRCQLGSDTLTAGHDCV